MVAFASTYYVLNGRQHLRFRKVNNGRFNGELATNLSDYREFLLLREERIKFAVIAAYK